MLLVPPNGKINYTITLIVTIITQIFELLIKNGMNITNESREYNWLCSGITFINCYKEDISTYWPYIFGIYFSYYNEMRAMSFVRNHQLAMNCK